MIMIELNDKWVINADQRNYMLVRKGVSEKGEGTQKVEAYCTSLQHCLQCIYQIETKEYIQKNNTTLKDAIAAFREIWADIKSWGGRAQL